MYYVISGDPAGNLHVEFCADRATLDAYLQTLPADTEPCASLCADMRGRAVILRAEVVLFKPVEVRRFVVLGEK